MEIPTDVYEYIGQFVEDKDILSMLSVNKKFNDSIFFERALRRKYPFLLDFKTIETNWRQFYVSMIFYISKLKEVFRNDPMIDLIGILSFDPHKIQIGSNVWNEALKAAIASNDLGLIRFFTDKLKFNSASLFGFLSPVVVKQPMLDFIKNANFDILSESMVTLKEVLRPIVKLGVFTRSILTLLLSIYSIVNGLQIREQGPKFFKSSEDMNKYLDPIWIELETHGIDRNKYRYSVYGKLISYSLLNIKSLTETQKNNVLNEKTKRLIFGLNEILKIHLNHL